MNGLRITIPGLTLPGDAPQLIAVDPIESVGSLVLIEPAHPAGPWDSGVPVDGGAVPNLLWKQAADVYGEGSEASLAGVVTSGNMDGTVGLVERTVKGGLHGIVSQSDAMTTDETGELPRLEVGVDDGFRAWMYLHPDHALYYSVWGEITRAHNTGTIGATYTGDLGETIWALRAGGQKHSQLGKAPLGNDLGERNNNQTIVGPIIVTGADMGWSSTPSSSTATNADVVHVGYSGPVNPSQGGTSTARGRWSSIVFYRVYVEDLTVSGRTYAEVDALDYALYTKHVLTPGGRYYGDTWTDPDTIP